MITEEQIKTEIAKLEMELASLKQAHEYLVNEDQKRQQVFQQQVLQNRIDFQQLTGAVNHLKKLLPPSEPTNDKPA